MGILVLDGFDSIGGDHGPSDALFVANMWSRFWGSTRQARSIPRSRNVVTEAPAAALARRAALEGQELEAPREAPGGGAEAPVRGTRAQAEPPAVADTWHRRLDEHRRNQRRGWRIRAGRRSGHRRRHRDRRQPGGHGRALRGRRERRRRGHRRSGRHRLGWHAGKRRRRRRPDGRRGFGSERVQLCARRGQHQRVLGRCRLRSGAGAGSAVARSSSPSVPEVRARDVSSCRAGRSRTASSRPCRRIR